MTKSKRSAHRGAPRAGRKLNRIGARKADPAVITNSLPPPSADCRSSARGRGWWRIRAGRRPHSQNHYGRGHHAALVIGWRIMVALEQGRIELDLATLGSLQHRAEYRSRIVETRNQIERDENGILAAHSESLNACRRRGGRRARSRSRVPGEPLMMGRMSATP